MGSQISFYLLQTTLMVFINEINETINDINEIYG